LLNIFYSLNFYIMSLEVFSFRPLLTFIFLFGACTHPLELEPRSVSLGLSSTEKKAGIQQGQLHLDSLQFTALTYARGKSKICPNGQANDSDT
jgi:hypothetical protein